MRIYEVKSRDEALVKTRVSVWERSVRATHLFLSDGEIGKIKRYVPQALQKAEHLIVVENEDGEAIAFMGIEKDRLEMLFLLPAERGRGLGRTLLQKAVLNYGVREVTVNEQNPEAVGFYKHMGFEIYRRAALDEEGNPYPLLYMRKASSEGYYEKE